MSATATPPAAEAAERRELVGVARELARQELAPRVLELDERRPQALRAAWAYVAEIGFDRALLGAEREGAGIDPASLLLCLEEIATGDAGIATQVLLANAALLAMPASAATPAPGERWTLIPVASGSPAGGALEIVARQGGLAAEGSTYPALGALEADGVVLAAPGREAAVLALPAGAAGLRLEPVEPQLGLRSAPAARLRLAAASGAAAGEEEAAAGAAAAIELLRAGSAAIARGVSRRAHELALDYAQNRIQGGVAIVAHDAVREMLAAMAVRQAAQPCLDELRGEAASLSARAIAADAAVETTTDAVQVFGGAGYMHETGVEKLMRDAKWLQLWPRPTWLDRDELVEPLSR